MRKVGLFNYRALPLKGTHLLTLLSTFLPCISRGSPKYAHTRATEIDVPLAKMINENNQAVLPGGPIALLLFDWIAIDPRT